MKSTNGDYANIPIPNIIIDKIQEHIKGTEFNSVSEYIIFILQEVLEEKDKSVLTKEEENQVKQRLKDLGYLE
jgi:Arc/MetJ-type ribon-helix-helix transcriptional regulator